MQAASAMILNTFCKDSKADYEEYLSQLFRATIGLLAYEDSAVLSAGWDCVQSIVKVTDGFLLKVFTLSSPFSAWVVF